MWCSCSQHRDMSGVHVPSIVDRWGRALTMSVVFMFPALWTGGEGR